MLYQYSFAEIRKIYLNIKTRIMKNVNRFYEWMIMCGIDTSSNEEVERAIQKIPLYD
jgi:hypothetical protein